MSARLDAIDQALPFDIVELVAWPGCSFTATGAPVRETAFRIDGWSATEIEGLVTSFRADHALNDIADQLGRTLSAVRTKVYDLGLRRNSSRPWTELDDKYLVGHYGQAATADVAAALGRSVVATYARANGLGLSEPAAPDWTPWEDAQLRLGYAEGVPVAMLSTLIGRPLTGVSTRASVLGLKHRNWRPEWSDAEEALALELAEQGRTARQISTRLSETGPAIRSRAAVKMMLRQLGLDRGWGRPWLPEEVDALRHVYSVNGSVAKLALRLGRSRSALSWKVRDLGLSGSHARAGKGFRQGDDWTDDQTKTLRARYGTEPVKATAAALGRPLRAVYMKANSLGLSTAYFKEWSAEDDRAVEIAYRHRLSIHSLAKALGRDATVASKRAVKLGMAFKARPKGALHPCRDWTLSDILALDVA